MNKLRNLLVISVLILAISCKYFQDEELNKKPLARVFDKYLFEEDVVKVISGTDLNQADSLVVVKSYVHEWIKRQLLITKAELNLTDAIKDVKQELEDYRASLLIYRYEQEFIRQNMDTTVSEKELNDFYLIRASEFPLLEHVVKGLIIKINAKDPNIKNVKKWYRSDKEEDLSLLKDYCFLHAQMFDTKDKWSYFNDFVANLPDSIINSEKLIVKDKFLEQQDSLYKYFVRIKDYKLESDTVPLYFISNKIKALILNKRKTKLIRSLEKNIYNDALDMQHVEIYENN